MHTRDLDAVELRRRGTHSFRRAFQSLAIGDGAPRECIRALAHTGDRDSTDIYLAIPWESLCAAVSKLDVKRRAMAEVIALPVAVGAKPTDHLLTKLLTKKTKTAQTSGG